VKTSVVELIISDHQSWRDWADEYPLRPVAVPDLGNVTVIETRDDSGYYDEGSDDAHMVFKVEGEHDTKYYQKNGERTSYSTRWDGSFYEVLGTPKTIYVYERIPNV
jgi:hypothetical protein